MVCHSVGQAIRKFQTVAANWVRCRTVRELIQALQHAEKLDKDAVTSLEQQSRQLLSNDLREAAMLALTLQNFGGDGKKLLEEVKASPGDANLDIMFRALAECGAAEPPFPASEAFDAQGALEQPRQVYNFICAACTFQKRGGQVDINRLIMRLKDMNLQEFNTIQIMQMAAGLAAIDPTIHEQVLKTLCDELSTRKLNEVDISDLVEAMAQISKYYQHITLINVFEETMKLHCAEHALLPHDICLVLYTLSRYRTGNTLLMDRLSVNIRRDAGSYNIEQLSRIIVALSQIGYHNKPLVAIIARMVLTIIDPEMTADVQLLTNLYTGFSRFLQHKRLFDTFSAILRKEEVLADLQVHDAVAIVQSYARVHVVDEKLFALLDAKLFTKPMNTNLSMKLLVAHGKLRYSNPRLQHALVNNINLQEINSTIDREVSVHEKERSAILCNIYAKGTVDSCDTSEYHVLTQRRS
ncbi:uncharacterized protein BXIN_0384 [Babesia sp. Xinjiang]|uniref:uncharacterized protein n=1 Tax=Babesia sp. Xinjiang TaxID=462227 RepID=UPI000A219B93|nr:uncharacterized protein BXIN_0384 [Babesia sp. Xinjiang]ORM41069.1 hypothetical protein BXIN_0384 [Babesia sp. Xinjiang]